MSDSVDSSLVSCVVYTTESLRHRFVPPKVDRLSCTLELFTNMLTSFFLVFRAYPVESLRNAHQKDPAEMQNVDNRLG